MNTYKNEEGKNAWVATHAFAEHRVEGLVEQGVDEILSLSADDPEYLRNALYSQTHRWGHGAWQAVQALRTLRPGPAVVLR